MAINVKEMNNITLKTTDKLAKDFDRRFSHRDMNIHYTPFLNNLKGRNILDIGCGTGRDTNYFSKLKYTVMGIDVSEEMLKIARQREGTYINMNMKDIRFDYKFDGIWCCASLYHLTRKEAMYVLNDIYNILKPKGILFLAIKEGEGERYISGPMFKGLKKYYSFYSINEILNLLKGFKLIQLTREEKENKVWLNILVRK